MEQEFSIVKQDFTILKEKIIKTNELLLLYKERSDKLLKAAQAFKTIKLSYETSLNECNRLKIDNERLNDTIGRLQPCYEKNRLELGQMKEEYSSLEQRYHQHLIESQLVHSELEAKVNQCICEKDLDLSPSKSKKGDEKIKELKQLCSKLKEAEEQLTKQNRDLMRKYDTLKKKLPKESLEKELAEVKQELQATDSSLKLHRELEQRQSKEINVLKEQISHLSSEKAKLSFDLESEYNSLKAIKSNENRCDRSVQTDMENGDVRMDEDEQICLEDIFRETILSVQQLSPLSSSSDDTTLPFSVPLTSIDLDKNILTQLNVPNITVTPPTPCLDLVNTPLQFPLLADMEYQDTNSTGTGKEKCVVNDQTNNKSIVNHSTNFVINKDVTTDNKIISENDKSIDHSAKKDGAVEKDVCHDKFDLIDDKTNTDQSINNKLMVDHLKSSVGEARRRKFWFPYGTNMFVKSKHIRKRTYERSDSILSALRTLQKHNINFTISNESIPLAQPYPGYNYFTSSTFERTKTTNLFTCQLDCWYKECNKKNSLMMLRESSVGEEPQLLGFFSVKDEISTPGTSRMAVREKVEAQPDFQELIKQLLAGLKDFARRNRPRKILRKNKVKVLQNSSEFTSETEPELEKLFSSEVLKRNKKLLEAKGQPFVEGDITNESDLENEHLEEDVSNHAQTDDSSPEKRVTDIALCPLVFINDWPLVDKDMIATPYCPTMISPLAVSTKNSPAENANSAQVVIKSSVCQKITFDDVVREGGKFKFDQLQIQDNNKQNILETSAGQKFSFDDQDGMSENESALPVNEKMVADKVSNMESQGMSFEQQELNILQTSAQKIASDDLEHKLGESEESMSKGPVKSFSEDEGGELKADLAQQESKELVQPNIMKIPSVITFTKTASVEICLAQEKLTARCQTINFGLDENVGTLEQSNGAEEPKMARVEIGRCESLIESDLHSDSISQQNVISDQNPCLEPNIEANITERSLKFRGKEHVICDGSKNTTSDESFRLKIVECEDTESGDEAGKQKPGNIMILEKQKVKEVESDNIQRKNALSTPTSLMISSVESSPEKVCTKRLKSSANQMFNDQDSLLKHWDFHKQDLNLEQGKSKEVKPDNNHEQNLMKILSPKTPSVQSSPKNICNHQIKSQFCHKFTFDNLDQFMGVQVDNKEKNETTIAKSERCELGISFSVKMLSPIAQNNVNWTSTAAGRNLSNDDTEHVGSNQAVLSPTNSSPDADISIKTSDLYYSLNDINTSVFEDIQDETVRPEETSIEEDKKVVHETKDTYCDEAALSHNTRNLRSRVVKIDKSYSSKNLKHCQTKSKIKKKIKLKSKAISNRMKSRKSMTNDCSSGEDGNNEVVQKDLLCADKEASFKSNFVNDKHVNVNTKHIWKQYISKEFVSDSDSETSINLRPKHSKRKLERSPSFFSKRPKLFNEDNTINLQDFPIYERSLDNEDDSSLLSLIVPPPAEFRTEVEAASYSEQDLFGEISESSSDCNHKTSPPRKKLRTKGRQSLKSKLMKQCKGTVYGFGNQGCYNSSRNTVEKKKKIIIVQDILLAKGKEEPPQTGSRRVRKNLATTTSTPVDILSQVLESMTKPVPKLVVQQECTKKGGNICAEAQEVLASTSGAELNFDDCPRSPDAVEVVGVADRLPKLIPLETPKVLPPSQVVVLMKRLMVFSNDESMFEEIVREFAFQDTDYVVQILMDKLCHDVLDKADNTFPPSPPMTSTQRILLGFMLKLEKSTHPEILDKFLSKAELKLYNSANRNVRMVQPITRLYTAVWKMRRNIDRIRRFLAECFYFTDDLVVPIFFTVLTMWPDVLPMKSNVAQFPLAKVFVQLCYLKTCNTPGYHLLPLRDLLHKYYGYPTERWNCDDVFEEILVNYIRNPSIRLSDFTLLLFLKHKPIKWVQEKLNNNLLPLYQLIPKENANLRGTFLILLGNICSNLVKDCDFPVINKIDEWFEQLQNVETNAVVQRSLLLAISRLPKRYKRWKQTQNRANAPKSAKEVVDQCEYNLSDVNTFSQIDSCKNYSEKRHLLDSNSSNHEC